MRRAEREATKNNKSKEKVIPNTGEGLFRYKGKVFGFERVPVEKNPLVSEGIVPFAEPSIYKQIVISKKPLGYNFGINAKFPTDVRNNPRYSAKALKQALYSIKGIKKGLESKCFKLTVKIGQTKFNRDKPEKRPIVRINYTFIISPEEIGQTKKKLMRKFVSGIKNPISYTIDYIIENL